MKPGDITPLCNSLLRFSCHVNEGTGLLGEYREGLSLSLSPPPLGPPFLLGLRREKSREASILPEGTLMLHITAEAAEGTATNPLADELRVDP